MKHCFRDWYLPLLAASALCIAGCAGEMAYRDGKGLLREGKLEEGLDRLQKATRADPENLEFRVAYLNARESISGRLLANAQRETADGHFDAADALYKRVLSLDPDHRRAKEGLRALDKERRHQTLVREAESLLLKGELDSADQRIALVLLEDAQNPEARALKKKLEELAGRNQVIPPALRKTMQKPVNLELRDANLKQLVEALSRYSGLNFVLDKDIPPNLSMTLFLRQVSVEDALDVMLTTLSLDKRILNDSTLLIYPNTSAKQTEHQDLVVKTFYLANANAKQVMEMLKTVLKLKTVYVDEKLNLLIMRDSPTAIRLAERLIAMQDVAEPEVMLEVEVMEVQRSRLQQLGIQFPDQLTLTPLPSGTILTAKDLRNLNSSRVGAAISNTVINLHKDIGETNILANPRIRTHNREKAEIKIGDRVPVITTTSTSTGFVAESVQYVDVGLKLNVEPTVSPDDEVAIKVGLEVSSVVKEVISKAGSLSYQIGSRNATTVLRLKDGETQILGGLINDQDQTTANRVPGLGDFPMLGRLFSSQKDNTQKTELVLSITPHIIRGMAPPPHIPTEFWSGTENNLKLRPLASIGGTSNKSIGDAADRTATSRDTRAGNDSQPSSLDVDTTSVGKAPALSWEGAPQAHVGSTLVLKLNASSTEGISGFPLQVKYDPEVLELKEALAGDFMGQGGVSPEFTHRIVPGAGMVFLTQTRKSAEGAKGDGTVVELQFKVLKPSPKTLVNALPATALAPGNVPLAQTGPTLIGVTVTP